MNKYGINNGARPGTGHHSPFCCSMARLSPHHRQAESLHAFASLMHDCEHVLYKTQFYVCLRLPSMSMSVGPSLGH